MQCGVVRGVDENIIHVNGDVAFVDELTEEVVHHGLEGGGGICEAKEHDHWLKEAAIRFERGLPLVAIAHTDIVVPPTDIQLRKERRPAAVHPCESIHELSDEWEWGGVVHSEGVQSAVILDRSEITIFLLNEEEGECIRGFGLADVSLFKVLCDEFLQGDVFTRGQRVDFAVHRIRGVWFQINGVIPLARFREAMCSVFTEYFHMFVVMGQDDLVPGAYSFIGGLLCKLLCYRGFRNASRVDLHDVEVQLLSGFKERLVSDCGPHSRDPYRAHWFPRCHSFGADND